jgi:hypothetical protein
MPPTATCSYSPQDTSSGGEETVAAAGAEPVASMPVVPLAAAVMPEVAPYSFDFLEVGEFSPVALPAATDSADMFPSYSHTAAERIVRRRGDGSSCRSGASGFYASCATGGRSCYG